MRKSELLRRRRLGHIKRLLRDRYGPVLPDDDSGREDLHELLLPVSLHPAAKQMMHHAVEVHAPWMPEQEATALIEEILALPETARRVSAKMLGQRLNLTNAERERLQLWTIWPADMTARQMAAWRKAKKRARDLRRHRRAGRKARADYLACSLTKQKPWKAERISRASWYRRHRRPKAAAA